MKKTKTLLSATSFSFSLFQQPFGAQQVACHMFLSSIVPACPLFPTWSSTQPSPKAPTEAFCPRALCPELLTLPLCLSNSARASEKPVLSSVSSRGDTQKMLPGVLEMKLMVAAGSDRFALVGCSDRAIRRHLNPEISEREPLSFLCV